MPFGNNFQNILKLQKKSITSQEVMLYYFVINQVTLLRLSTRPLEHKLPTINKIQKTSPVQTSVLRDLLSLHSSDHHFAYYITEKLSTLFILSWIVFSKAKRKKDQLKKH